MDTLSKAIAIAGGIAAALATTVLLREAIRGVRQQRLLRRNRSPSFIGGLRQHATGGISSGMRYNATWPFARLDISDGQIAVSLSADLAWVTRLLRFPMPPKTSLYASQVRQVDADFGTPFSRGVRFRTTDPSDERDGLVFWTMRRDRAEILRLLAASGFPVTG